MSKSFPIIVINIVVGLVVFNRVIQVQCDGYNYPVPQQPPLVQFDEPSTPTSSYLPPASPPFQDEIPQVIPTYIPPPIYPPIGSPPLTDEIQPPYDDTVIIPSPPTNQYLPPIGTRQTQIRILNMTCLDARDGSQYFRVNFRTGTATRIYPVIESAPADCLVSPVGLDNFRIDLEGQRMIDCGVRTCSSRMCLTVRMASITGLRLADDTLVTLQCIPQETVVVHTKHLRLNTLSEQGRSTNRAIAVASGGNQRRFDTQISLLRRRSGSELFDQSVQQGSAVRLGDELMLRAAVRDGDGWKQSRMGSVIIRSAATQRSVTLVDDDGCRNPTMKSICPQQPQQITPLSIQLPFRAFLFQGAAPADDLLLSVRMSGCLRPRDCYQSRTCEDPRARNKRSSSSSNSTTLESGENGTITNWETEFQFRVLPYDLPNIEENEINPGEYYNKPLQIQYTTLVCMLALIGVLVCVILVVIKNLKL